MQIDTTTAAQGQDVIAWRHDQLCEAGFPLPAAERLAIDTRFDLHALIELVDRGCPAELAERILAPADWCEPA